MNKKGFTLVELLAVVAILGIIGIVSIPNMTKEISKNEDQTKDTVDKQIEDATKLFVAKYYTSYLLREDCPVFFTLQDLQSDGLINVDDRCSNDLDKKIYVTSL